MDNNRDTRGHGTNTGSSSRQTRRRRKRTPFQRFMHRNIGRILVFSLIAFGAVAGTMATYGIMHWKNTHDQRDYGRELAYAEYVVQSGDTMWSIAADMAALNPEFQDMRQYLYLLQKTNGNYGDMLLSGSTVLIPYYRSETGRDFVSIYERYGIVMDLENK